MTEDENKQIDLNAAAEDAVNSENGDVKTLGDIMSDDNSVSEEVKAPETETAPEEDTVSGSAFTSFETEKEEEEKSGEDAPVEEMTAEEAVASETDSNEKKTPSKGFKLEKGTTAYEVFDWIRTICIGVLAGIFIVVFLVQKDNVYGDSMNPTLNSGDAVFAQKISNYFKSYKRGDIVVLDGHDMEGYYSKEYLIKRIVGLPGETVRIADGNVYIKPVDSSEFFLLQENYLPQGTKTIMGEGGLKKGYDEVLLGEGEYYVLGDNRPVSNDSRYLGPFTSDRIKGVAIVRIYPLNEMKVL
jgi:signal peptidase I